MLKLISATPSPYAQDVRIALAEKGLPFELLTEVPWDKTPRRQNTIRTGQGGWPDGTRPAVV